MRPPRRHAPLATIALGLSVWMVLPSLEWCPFRWEDCRESCSDAELVACGTPLAACDAAATPAPESACATACPLQSEPIAGGCDPTPDPIPFGDRAYCVHPPADGLVVHPIQLDPPAAAPLLAVLAPPLDLRPPVVPSTHARVAAFLPPPLAAPHAPPLARAPPVA